MRHLILIVIYFFLGSFGAYAQIGYGATYNRQQQSTETNLDNSQVLTTTAYSQGYNGQYLKMRIRIQVNENGYGGASMRVVEKYTSSGLGGQWTKIYSGSDVRKCTPMASMEQLEQNFMYKATIDTKTWYFDL